MTAAKPTTTTTTKRRPAAAPTAPASVAATAPASVTGPTDVMGGLIIGAAGGSTADLLTVLTGLTRSAPLTDRQVTAATPTVIGAAFAHRASLTDPLLTDFDAAWAAFATAPDWSDPFAGQRATLAALAAATASVLATVDPAEHADVMGSAFAGFATVDPLTVDMVVSATRPLTGQVREVGKRAYHSGSRDLSLLAGRKVRASNGRHGWLIDPTFGKFGGWVADDQTTHKSISALSRHLTGASDTDGWRDFNVVNVDGTTGPNVDTVVRAGRTT